MNYGRHGASISSILGLAAFGGIIWWVYYTTHPVDAYGDSTNHLSLLLEIGVFMAFLMVAMMFGAIAMAHEYWQTNVIAKRIKPSVNPRVLDYYVIVLRQDKEIELLVSKRRYEKVNIGDPVYF